MANATAERHPAITDRQREVIVLIAAGCSNDEVGERLGISPAATSRALDGLVNKGILVRTESAEDRRVRLFAITADGRAAAERLAALKRAQLERFVAGLEPGQREALSAALDDLATGEDA